MDTGERENYLDRKSGFGGDTGEFAHSAENRELSGILGNCKPESCLSVLVGLGQGQFTFRYVGERLGNEAREVLEILKKYLGRLKSFPNILHCLHCLRYV